MKKILFTLLLSVVVAAGAFATPKEVTSAILSNFNYEFKKASDVSWVVTKEYTKAVFTEDKIRREVIYSFDGDIIGISKTITLEELPLNAKRPFAKQFSGYNVKEAILFEGFNEKAYYISGENEKESVILKVNDQDKVSVFKRVKK